MTREGQERRSRSKSRRRRRRGKGKSTRETTEWDCLPLETILKLREGREGQRKEGGGRVVR